MTGHFFKIFVKRSNEESYYKNSIRENLKKYSIG